MWSRYILPAIITGITATIFIALFLRIPGVASVVFPTAAAPATGKKLLIAA